MKVGLDCPPLELVGLDRALEAVNMLFEVTGQFFGIQRIHLGHGALLLFCLCCANGKARCDGSHRASALVSGETFGQIAAQLHHVHLIRPIGQTQGTCITEEVDQRGILAQAHRTVDLDRPIDDI